MHQVVGPYALPPPVRHDDAARSRRQHDGPAPEQRGGLLELQLELQEQRGGLFELLLKLQEQSGELSLN